MRDLRGRPKMYMPGKQSPEAVAKQYCVYSIKHSYLHSGKLTEDKYMKYDQCFFLLINQQKQKMA